MTKEHLNIITNLCNQIENILPQMEYFLDQEDTNEIPYESCTRCDSKVILENLKDDLEGLRINIDLLEAHSIIRRTAKGRKLMNLKNDKKRI